ncbi:MAG: plastocyanin/azurin family copper-binding protein [Solirubrobacterales bacterium]
MSDPTTTAPGAAPPEGSDPAPAAGAAPAVTPMQAPPPAASPSPSQPPTTVSDSRAGASATKSVSIVDFSFSPGSISVTLGDTVRWTNQDAAPEGHDVTGDGLDSGLMNQGDTYIHTFSSAGTVSYICTIHPSMKGTVNVLARSPGGSGDDGDTGAAGGDGPSNGAPAGSDPAAVASPGAAGSGSSLPATGENWLTAAAAGLGLLCLGLALRTLPSAGPRRR